MIENDHTFQMDGSVVPNAESAPSEEQSKTPEADRLFAPPSPEQAAHILRELSWGEQFVAVNMAFARGPVETYFYSLEDATAFFNDTFSASASTRTGSSYKAVKMDGFIAWIRDVVGDLELARVLDERISATASYNDKVEVLSDALAMRTAQIEACRRS